MNIHTPDLLSAEPKSNENTEKVCEQCGRKFSPRAGSGGKPQRFCSPQCRAAFHADAQPDVGQRSPTCSAPTTSLVVMPAAKKDEPAATGGDFDWAEDGDDVVLHEQPTTAVYFNPNGGLVIRQMASWYQEEDAIVVIAASCIPEFLDRLTDICNIPSVGR